MLLVCGETSLLLNQDCQRIESVAMQLESEGFFECLLCFCPFIEKSPLYHLHDWKGLSPTEG